LALAGLTSQAGIFTFTATLTGAQSTPPNASTASGNVSAVYDSTQNEFAVSGSYSGLQTSATAAHVHLGAVGVAGAVQVPLVVVGGTSGVVLAGPVSLTGQQITDLMAGDWYVNIHDSVFPGGEIRGQLLLTSVPEPETYAAFAGVGLLGFAAWRRFRA